MLPKLLKNTKFLYKIKSFYSKNKNQVLDIILFGSSVKGKECPKDIDILILCKNRESLDLSYSLKKSLGKEYNAEVISKTYASLLSASFKATESVLIEGYSLLNGKKISGKFGFVSFVLFKYDLKGKTKSERMRFYYSLYGRTKKDKGILDKYNLIKFSETIVLSPVEESEKVKKYFNSWEISFKEFPVLMPERLTNIM
ncbi:nucleotidyltransferase domain-containing protein [Candidatus Woesearchaeota archaeon]|nr:nucleotidyltransferase domain-containing protein [Candidatus Woesearchaeota archaeon]